MDVLSDSWEKNELNNDEKSFEELFVTDERLGEKSNGVCWDEWTRKYALFWIWIDK